jgi:hypothetical protein
LAEPTTTVPEGAEDDSGLEALLAALLAAALAAVLAGLLAELLELELLLEQAVTAERAATETAASPAVTTFLIGISCPFERIFVFHSISCTTLLNIEPRRVTVGVLGRAGRAGRPAGR